jgi:hypothetical protein
MISTNPSLVIAYIDMIETFSDLPLWAQAGTISLHALAVILLSLGLMRWLRAWHEPLQQIIPVGPFFVAISTVFSLLLAFHGSSIWSKQERAERALFQDELNLHRLRQLSHPDLLNLIDLTLATNQYAQAVVDSEWLTGRNQRGSEAVETALQNLRKTIIRLDRDIPPPVHSYVLHLLDDLVRSREERLWLRSQPQKYKIWTVILFLGLLSHLAIALVHLDKPKAGTFALYLFGVATSLAYWLLLSTEDPYQALSSLNPTILLK